MGIHELSINTLTELNNPRINKIALSPIKPSLRIEKCHNVREQVFFIFFFWIIVGSRTKSSQNSSRCPAIALFFADARRYNSKFHDGFWNAEQGRVFGRPLLFL